jgi:hypothetical protein
MVANMATVVSRLRMALNMLTFSLCTVLVKIHDCNSYENTQSALRLSWPGKQDNGANFPLKIRRLEIYNIIKHH